MNQHDDKADGGLGSNAQGSESEHEPESMRIKLDDDVDDPYIQHIKENQVDDDDDDGSRKPMEEALSDDDGSRKPMEEALSDSIDDGSCKPVEEALSGSSTQEGEFKREYEDPCAPFWDSDEKEPELSAYELVMPKYKQEWRQELAERGIDVESFEQSNWKGECGFCGDVDKHPTSDCPYIEFIEL